MHQWIFFSKHVVLALIYIIIITIIVFINHLWTFGILGIQNMIFSVLSGFKS